MLSISLTLALLLLPAFGFIIIRFMQTMFLPLTAFFLTGRCSILFSFDFCSYLFPLFFSVFMVFPPKDYTTQLFHVLRPTWSSVVCLFVSGLCWYLSYLRPVSCFAPIWSSIVSCFMPIWCFFFFFLVFCALSY